MAVSATKTSRPVVVDASGQIVGRLASHVAKLLLNGERVVVVNAEQALFSGRRSTILQEWLGTLEIASVVHPKFGPFHPRTPDRIFKRVVRGMVPRRKPRGLQAWKRLRVHVGIPAEYGKREKRVFEDAKATKPLSYYVPLADVARQLGWKGS